MSLMKGRHPISDCSTRNYGLQHDIVKPLHHRPQTHLHNPSSNLQQLILKQNQGLIQSLTSSTRLLPKYCDKNTRDFAMYSGVEPGLPSSGGPPPNILSWIVAVAMAVVLPFINYKWGPLLKSKVESAMQITEDVAEAVEKVAEEVEKVAEEIADDLPEGGKFRKAVDFVEKVAEIAAKDAGAVDDFIDKVQEEEEKAESFVESFKDESKKPPKAGDENSNDQTLNK